MATDIDDLYGTFARIWGDGHPIRSAPEVEAAMRAADLEYDEVDDEWLRALSRAWVYHESEDPFEDDMVNRAYRRELRELLA